MPSEENNPGLVFCPEDESCSVVAGSRTKTGQVSLCVVHVVNGRVKRAKHWPSICSLHGEAVTWWTAGGHLEPLVGRLQSLGSGVISTSGQNVARRDALACRQGASQTNKELRSWSRRNVFMHSLSHFVTVRGQVSH